MSKGEGVKIMMEKPTETADLSLWERIDSGTHLHLGDSCIAWSFVGPLAMGQDRYLMHGLALWSLSPVVGCLL